MAAKASDWRPGPSVCRCCFAEGCYKDISTEYFWMGKKEVYSEMLSDTFDVSIAYSQTGGPNSNSRLICEPCISRLRDASDFKRQVQECERVFLQHLAQPSSSIEIEIQDVEKEEVKLERVKVEAKLDDDDEDFDDRLGFADEDDDDMDDQPLTKLASKVPKEESEELLKSLLLGDTKKPEKRKSSTKVKTSPVKKSKKESPKPSVSKPAPKTVAEKKKKDIDRWGVNAATRNAALILRHSTAYPFEVNRTSLRCCFCTLEFDNPEQFRSHFNYKHINTDMSYIVTDDYPTRVDITSLSCKECIKTRKFLALAPLVEHLNDEHEAEINTSYGLGLVPVKFDKDYQCVDCEKKFEEAATLFRHLDEDCGKNSKTDELGSKTDELGSKTDELGSKTNELGSKTDELGSKTDDFEWEVPVSEIATVTKENDSSILKSSLSGRRNAARNAIAILKNSTAYPFQIYRTSLRCFFCIRLFDDPDIFRNHCDDGHQNVDRSYINFERSQIRVDITNLRCKSCTNSEIFNSLEDLVKHLNMKHDKGVNSQNLGLVPVKLDKDCYKCVICDEKFRGMVALSRHAGKHYCRYECDSCGKEYENIRSLRTHVLICRSDKHHCRHCKATFPSHEEKIKHLRQSSYRCKPFKCKACKLGFTASDQLQTHLENSHGRQKKTFKCVECKKVFPKYMALYFHFKAKHTADYKCQYCSRTFPSKNSLSSHINTHVGVKSFTCDVCNRGFNNVKNLKVHVKIHDDAQKLACPACDKLFVRKRSAEDHIRRHHPECVPQDQQ